MIRDCLLSLKFSDEIIIVDSGNTDATNEIAKSFGARIVSCKGDNFAEFRNIGLKAARKAWVLYVDADERVTPLLKMRLNK